MLKRDVKQQKALKEFYEIETTYQPNHVLINFLFGLFAFICSFFFIMPTVMLESRNDILCFMIVPAFLLIFGCQCFTTKYTKYSECSGNNNRSVRKILEMVPVERMQYLIFRVEKLLKYLVPYTFIVLVLRITISVGFCGTLSIWDVVYPILACILCPVLYELIDVVTGR